MLFVIALTVLNTIDAAQTICSVGPGWAYEVNPFMAWLISVAGIGGAMLIKVTYVPILAAYMFAHGFNKAIKIMCVIYAIVCLNGAFLIMVHHAQ